MKKIFKYQVSRNTGTDSVTMPLGAQIVRMADVNDKFYSGSFVWAIVDTSEACIAQQIDYKSQGEFDSYDVHDRPICKILKIKEKQEVLMARRPSAAKCVDGLPYVFGGKRGEYVDYQAEEGNLKPYRLAFYKTGQEIDLPVSKLEYIGVCKLQIIQELALYTFLVK